MWTMSKEAPAHIITKGEGEGKTFKTLWEAFKYRRTISESFKAHWAGLTEHRRFR